jgi:disabled homolog 2
VHKISFIAQDMTDSRSFGYIFGSPDCGHRFFGIKTDKAASQVVLAMRDLFQCVFELKKKEIELAKQHIQNRITAHEHQQVKNSILDHKKPTSLLSEAKSTTKAEKSPEATANLVDLEQELSSIQRGITQMERITPNDDAPTKNPLEDDPFGDSFTTFSSTPFSILPPPASSKRIQSKPSDDTMAELSSIMTKSSTPPIPPFPLSQSANVNAESWLSSVGGASSVFDELEPTNSFGEDPTADSNNPHFPATKPELIDAFSDLDPLGTGRSRPYVDKRYFFQDLKNPPKRVLKDLTEQESIFDAHFSPLKRPPTGLQTLSLDSSLTTSAGGGGSVFDSLKSIDPFEEEDFSKISLDQFESSKPSVSPKSIILPDTKISTFGSEKSKQDERKLSDQDSFNSPLHVDLPPESWASSSFSDPKRLDRQGSDSSSRNVFSVDAFSKKLPKSNLFGQRNVKRDSNGINMRRLQESDSLSENEPELPPRPDTGSHDPPPLPPKNSSYNDSDIRSRYSRTPTSQSSSRYDYTSRFKNQSSDSPPLPLPSRKINRAEISRPFRKSNDDDDYLTPNPKDIPTLLPPPQKKDPSKSRGARKSETDPKNLDAPTPPVSAKPSYEVPSTIAPILPDITLSQLLTLGIDDLAHKLNVPTSKLNTMTIIELTKYLTEFIEKSKPPPIRAAPVPVETPIESPVFKVSFDDANDATFVAKFDDNFGESANHDENSFVANFENFNQAPASVIPTADRYAVFREIIDQEMHQDSFHQESIESNNSNSLEEERGGSSFEFAKELDNSFSPVMDSQFKSPTPVQMAKIDTNITDAISGAKDRYAALRDIILVQDLFDKTAMPPLASISDSNLSDDQEDVEQVFDAAEAADNNSIDNVPTYSISWADAEANQSEVSDTQQQDDQKSLQIISTSQKDDLEIDEYMKKAISELSLDQRLSPNIQAAKLSPSPCQLEKPQTNVNDMSTSPIPIFASKSPQQAEKENSPCMVEQPEEAVTNEDKPSLDENMRSEESRGKLIMTNGLADFRDKVSSYIFLSLRLS